MSLRRKFSRISGRSKDYGKNGDGTAAIEFAFLAIPFFALIFGIIELAIILFVHSTLNHAVSEAGRQIRVGNFQACSGNSAQKFKDMICAEMGAASSCDQRVRVDVQTATTFAGVVLPAETDPANPTDPVTNGTVSNTSGGDPVVARAIYYYPLALPSALTRLETVKDSNVRKLFASTAFRNEPFSAPGTCPST